MTGLYRPLEFFAVRAPALPLEALASLAAGAIPQADLVDEAIAVASPALSDARGRLAERPAEDGRRAERAERVERTVLRYASRMSTRPTPFGLFAGVGTGRFGAPTSLSLGPVASWRKRTRPDMAWLLGVVKALERRPDVQAGLRVVASGAAQRVGPRLVLPFSSAWGPGDAGEQPRTNVSVRASPPVLRALELAGEWESAGSLVDALAADFPAAGRPRIEKLVAGLVENEFLITELVPPAGDPAPLDHVVATLERIPAAVEDLRALERLRARLAEYDGVAPGEGLERLGGITALMSDIAPAEKLVQVDMTFSEARVTLPESIGWDVARAAERLWRLGTPVLGLPHLRPWHLAFLERYGLGREVPVLEALSDEVGIGPPATYAYPAGDSPPPEPPAPSSGSERGRLAGHVVAALLQGHEELELTDELVEELSTDPDTSTAPASLELFAEIVAGSADDLDRGAYEVLLSPSLSSYGVGKASGRFGDLLGAPLMDQMASHYRREEAAGAPALFAELTHIPPAGRLANLTLVPCVRRFELPVGVAPSAAGSEPIALDDVLVCASAERLHLRSRSHGRELYVTAAHMVNLHLVPNVCRFLVEVFFEGVRLPGAIDWDPSLRLPRLPRVRHGRVIVAPASWNLYRHMLPEDDGSAESWAGRFRAWCAEWSVPGRVQLVMADQRLVLDLSVDAHLDPIRREFRSRGHACLAELPGGLAGRALRGPKGGHAMECVVAVERQGLGAAAVREEPPRPVIQAAVGNRIRGPGSDWLYLKLYGSRKRQAELLADHVLRFADEAVAGGLCSSWFYIRYSDPAPHVRLRFHGEPAALMALLAGSEPWARSLREAGLVRELVVGQYDPELERYGGPGLIDLAERVFAADSRLCARLLALARSPAIALPEPSLASIGIVDLLDRLGVDGFDEGWGADRALSEGMLMRELKGLAAALWLPDLPWSREGAPGSALGHTLGPLLAARAASLEEYRRGVERNPGSVRVRPIAGSLVHMHCNRLMGPSDDERRAVAIAAQLHRWRTGMVRRATGEARPVAT